MFNNTNNQTFTYSYSVSMTSSTLKRPVIGLIDFGFNIPSNSLAFQIIVFSYTISQVSFYFATDLFSNIARIRARILGVDNNFAPPFSMNYYESVNNLIKLDNCAELPD